MPGMNDIATSRRKRSAAAAATRTSALVVLVLLLATSSIPAQTASAGESLRDVLADRDIAPYWIYDDWTAAERAAARDDKPIFVVFRCVP